MQRAKSGATQILRLPRWARAVSYRSHMVKMICIVHSIYYLVRNQCAPKYSDHELGIYLIRLLCGWVEWQVSGAGEGGNGAASLVRAPLVPAGCAAPAVVPHLLSPPEAGIVSRFSRLGCCDRCTVCRPLNCCLAVETLLGPLGRLF